MKKPVGFPVILLATLCASCGPVTDPRSADIDLSPPQLQSVTTLGPQEISLQFDEDAGLRIGKTRITPDLAVVETTGPAKTVEIRAAPQSPGCPYTLEAEAQDARGNSASFIAQFYGFNGHVPKVLINEFTPRGSGSHPDIVELKVMTPGDMGGVALYLGTPGSFDAKLVFPSFAVTAGSFILVHLKPTGSAAEVDETRDMTVSRGFDASDTAWDFWLPGGTGISGTNGVISLYDRPGGSCLDAVLYSNRTTQSDEKYRGFGSAEMEARAEEIVSAGGWKAAGPRVTPEDAVSPEGSTGTRSLCRLSTSADTDQAQDWHLVPTRKATFGAENSDDVYVKPGG
jgi:hypothetical protein